jgi:hypothetical protein
MNLSLVRALPDWPKAWIAKQTDNEGIIGFLIDPPRIGSSPHDFGQGDSPTLIADRAFLVGRDYHSAAGGTSILGCVRWAAERETQAILDSTLSNVSGCLRPERTEWPSSKAAAAMPDSVQPGQSLFRIPKIQL